MLNSILYSRWQSQFRSLIDTQLLRKTNPGPNFEGQISILAKCSCKGYVSHEKVQRLSAIAFVDATMHDMIGLMASAKVFRTLHSFEHLSANGYEGAAVSNRYTRLNLDHEF